VAAILKYIQPKLHTLSNGLFANWMPDTLVSVGDYGVLRNGAFDRRGSLKDYGADIYAKPATQGENEIEFKDKIDLSVAAIANADSGVGPTAKISVTVRGKGAFLYHLSDVHQIRPVRQRRFEEEVAKALVSPSLELPDEAVLVTEVQHAAKATIVASDHREGRLELATDFGPAGSAYLSGARGNVSVSASAGSLFQWIARNDTVTLLKLVRPKLGPSPGGPGGPALTLSSAIAWLKTIIKAQNLTVSEFVFRPPPDDKDGFVIALGGHELHLTFPEIELMEVLNTIADDMTKEDEDAPPMPEVAEEAFRHEMRRTG